jgi:hypothetical protein
MRLVKRPLIFSGPLSRIPALRGTRAPRRKCPWGASCTSRAKKARLEDLGNYRIKNFRTDIFQFLTPRCSAIVNANLA